MPAGVVLRGVVMGWSARGEGGWLRVGWLVAGWSISGWSLSGGVTCWGGLSVWGGGVVALLVGVVGSVWLVCGWWGGWLDGGVEQEGLDGV